MKIHLTTKENAAVLKFVQHRLETLAAVKNSLIENLDNVDKSEPYEVVEHATAVGTQLGRVLGEIRVLSLAEGHLQTETTDLLFLICGLQRGITLDGVYGNNEVAGMIRGFEQLLGYLKDLD